MYCQPTLGDGSAANVYVTPAQTRGDPGYTESSPYPTQNAPGFHPMPTQHDPAWTFAAPGLTQATPYQTQCPAPTRGVPGFTRSNSQSGAVTRRVVTVAVPASSSHAPFMPQAGVCGTQGPAPTRGVIKDSLRDGYDATKGAIQDAHDLSHDIAQQTFNTATGIYHGIEDKVQDIIEGAPSPTRGAYAPPPTRVAYAPPPTMGQCGPPPTRGHYGPPPTRGMSAPPPTRGPGPCSGLVSNSVGETVGAMHTLVDNLQKLTDPKSTRRQRGARDAER